MLGLAEGDAEDRDLVDAGDAFRAVRDVDRRVEVVHEDADDLAEAERDDREIVAAQLQRRRAEQHAGAAGDQGAERDHHPPRRVQAARKRRRDRREGVGQLRRGEQAEHVGADRVEGDVAEVEQAGVADDDVEAERQQHVEQRDVDDAHPGVAGHLHHERQHEQRDRRDDEGGELVALDGGVHFSRSIRTVSVFADIGIRAFSACRGRPLGTALGGRPRRPRGRGRRCPSGAQAGAVGAARRLRCDARSAVASRNSLRSLRSLRSNSRDESDVDARCARRPRPCAARRHRNRPRRAPPAASNRGLGLAASTPTGGAKARSGRSRRASEAPRSAGLVAARAARINN